MLKINLLYKTFLYLFPLCIARQQKLIVYMLSNKTCKKLNNKKKNLHALFIFLNNNVH